MILNILVIDGMGGGLGKAIIEKIKDHVFDNDILAVGTNSYATSTMLKAGATFGATGENAILFNCGKADIIIGAIGILIANSMLGEISPQIALAVSASAAEKIIISVPQCNVSIAGLPEASLGQYLDDLPLLLKKEILKKTKNRL